MILYYRNVFAFSIYKEGDFKERDYGVEGGEESFEDTNIELYPNKEKFKTVFPNQLFGINGYYFFPGTYDFAELVLTLLGSYKDQINFLSLYTFISPFNR